MKSIICQLFRRKTPEDKFRAEWRSAVRWRNKVKMRKLLADQMKSCRSRNSHCGVEVFCPECPMIIPTQNYRHD